MNTKLKQWVNENYPLMQNEIDYVELDYNDMDKFADWLCGQIEPLAMPKIAEIIEAVSETNPYKLIGNPSSYSSYNEGWSDACDSILGRIEGFFKDNRTD